MQTKKVLRRSLPRINSDVYIQTERIFKGRSLTVTGFDTFFIYTAIIMVFGFKKYSIFSPDMTGLWAVKNDGLV